MLNSDQENIQHCSSFTTQYSQLHVALSYHADFFRGNGTKKERKVLRQCRAFKGNDRHSALVKHPAQLNQLARQNWIQQRIRLRDLHERPVKSFASDLSNAKVHCLGNRRSRAPNRHLGFWNRCASVSTARSIAEDFRDEFAGSGTCIILANVPTKRILSPPLQMEGNTAFAPS